MKENSSATNPPNEKNILAFLSDAHGTAVKIQGITSVLTCAKSK